MTDRHGRTNLKDLLSPDVWPSAEAERHGLDVWLSYDFQGYWWAASPWAEYRIMPPFRPGWPGAGFWLGGDRGEEPVLAIAARMMQGEGVDGRDAVRDLLPRWGGKWEIPEDVTLEGRLLCNGGQFISAGSDDQGQPWRGRKLSPFCCKCLHAVALVLYDFDYVFAVTEHRMWDRKLSHKQGFRHHERGLVWREFYDEDQHMDLIWSHRDEIIESLISAPR